MPFLAPAITAVGSFFGGIASWLGGSTILAGVARFGLGLAAKYALGSLLAPKRPAQSSQLETAYGEDLARTVALGKVGTAGQHVYRNAYSKGNRRVQDVYVLSHFRITRITRVRFEGKWCSLGGAEDPVRGFRVQGIDAQIWIKLYKGTMDQVADPGLIANANPAGRWTADHRGAGVAYAVVTNYLNREKLSQPWQAFFEIEGAPLYDWRKDSSIGGSGAHRWDDQSTWEFSENTVLQAYNLERGFWNGTEVMVGKGVSPSRLPLAEWTLAANVCDENVGTGRRYSSGLIAAAGSGVTHDQNLQPLLEASAATWVEDATGEYPIVGAAQSAAFTITDDDIMVDEPFRFSAKSTKSKLINTLAGTFQNPENFYEPAPITVRIDAAALAEDRERLASSIPFDAVNRLEVADRLADIAFKASRYQANAEICIHPKFLADAKPGRWFRWNSAARGDRKFQIIDKRLGPFGEKAARNVYLTCQEVGEGIFDPTAYQTVPPVVVAPGEPDYDQEVSGLLAMGVQIQVDGSSERQPALRFQWAAFDDVTVTAVDIEYRPVGQTDSIIKRAEVPLQVLTTPDGVLSDTDYEYRAKVVTDPPRTTFYGAWQEVRSPAMALPDVSVELGAVGRDVYATLQQLRADYADLRARMEMIAAGAADATGASIDLHTVARRFQDATAVAMWEMTASITENADGLAAQASILDAVQAAVGNVSADGLRKIEVTAGAGDVVARLTDLVRATIDDDWVEAGTVTEVGFTDGDPAKPFARMLFIAKQFVFTDGTNDFLPVVIEDGEIKLAIANIGTVRAGVIDPGNGKHRYTVSTGTFEWWD